MIDKIPSETKAPASTTARSNKNEQKKVEVMEPDHDGDGFEFSPVKSEQFEGGLEVIPRKFDFTGNHGHEKDHCATTTIRIIITTTFNSSMSAAMAQSVQGAVEGHSGVDHPLGAGLTVLSASFGEDPTPIQLQLGERGCGGVLSTPTMPSHTGTEEREQAGLAKPDSFSSREHPIRG